MKSILYMLVIKILIIIVSSVDSNKSIIGNKYFSLANSKYANGDFEGALNAYHLAIEHNDENPDYFCNLASLFSDMKRSSESELYYQKALELDQNHASSLFNYALLLQDKKHNSQAAILYKRLILLENNNADAFANLGSCMYEQLEFHDAIDAFNAALSIYLEEPGPSDPNSINLQSNLNEYIGRCHVRLNNPKEARKYFTKAIELNDNSLASHMLASIDGEQVDIAPANYISKLFDDYSSNFEKSLGELNYTAPKIISYSVSSIHSNYKLVVDLGCGTGLLAKELKELKLSNRIIGIDLSNKMLEVALAKNYYDLLIFSDILDFLHKLESDKLRRNFELIHSVDLHEYKNYIVSGIDNIKELNLLNFVENGLDNYPTLIAAADVFVYIGNLNPIFDSISKILDSGDIFAFTVEEYLFPSEKDLSDQSTNNSPDQIDWILQVSGRFAHSRDYILKLIEENENLKLQKIEKIIPRYENGNPINGLLFIIEMK